MPKILLRGGTLELDKMLCHYKVPRDRGFLCFCIQLNEILMEIFCKFLSLPPAVLFIMVRLSDPILMGGGSVQ